MSSCAKQLRVVTTKSNVVKNIFFIMRTNR
jgi:hypothetical protein